jgi:predicted aspartyl protease
LVIEFLIDTGFEGDFGLPDAIVRQIAAESSGTRNRMLADGSIRRLRCLELEWDDGDGEQRTLEVLVMEGRPLVGTHFFEGKALHIDVTQGGPVIVEDL